MNNHSLIRCSHRRCSVEKGVLKNFAVFTGKHLCWSVFLIDFRPAPLSSNINEAILNFFNLFFYEKILYAKKAPKSTKSTKKHQKHKKQKNATKQKHKTQIREQKLKMRLKNIWVENSNLSASLRFCVFCVSEGKKNEKSYNGNVLNTDAPINHFRCVYVYLRKPVCGDINLFHILTS